MRTIIAVLACALMPWPCLAQAPPAMSAPLIATEPGEAAVGIESASLHIAFVGGTARTTIDMTFRNPGTRILEGTLQFPLQPGQQVVAFSLDIDGHQRAAVPVEKERGRQVLEAIERRGADPGLLEQSLGEYFRLRIYPFAPHGSRTVRIVLSEPLASGATAVRLPPGLGDALSILPVTVASDGRPRLEGALRPVHFERASPGTYTATLRHGDTAPGRAPRVVLPPRATTAMQTQAWHGTRYFAADIPVDPATRPRTLPSRMTLLWDSSASGAKRAHDLEFALLDAYFAATQATSHAIDVDLVRFRDVVEPARRFTLHAGEWSALRRELQATVYDGATTLRGWAPAAGAGDVLLFSDGLFNTGEFKFPAFASGQRLYAIRAGVPGDAARLQALATARNGEALAIDDRAGLAAARDHLLGDSARLVDIDAIGAADVLAASPVARDGWLRIAGRLTDAAPRIMLTLARGAERITVAVPFADSTEGEAAAPAWARYRLAELMEAPGLNRAAISQLGRDFDIVTPGSSLLVLERVEDYVQYAITPPDELRASYDRLASEAARERADAHGKQLDDVRAQWRERVAWWSTPFPKDAPPKPANQIDDVAADAAAVPVSAPAPAAEAEQQATTLDRVVVTGSRIETGSEGGDGDAHRIGIQLQPWTPDSPFARRLRTADPDMVYRLYLDERERALPGTAFYLDVADVLFDRQRPQLALRVLSNLAELELDNRHVLRVLAYRLMQAGRADLAVPVLEQVLAMGDDEPQSYRDLALARAALGQHQQAIDLLYEVVTGTWDGRFPGIEITALAELNAIVATAPSPLDTHRIAADLLGNLPLDLRAVLTWDADNSDMDLWVTDPNGEKAYYSHQLTYQGGRMSPDFTGGYGPEEFALRNAKPGKYKVEANYFGDRQQVVTGPPTLQLWLSTRFGTPRQQDQRITLRLKDEKDTVFVGEFEVK